MARQCAHKYLARKSFPEVADPLRPESAPAPSRPIFRLTDVAYHDNLEHRAGSSVKPWPMPEHSVPEASHNPSFIDPTGVRIRHAWRLGVSSCTTGCRRSPLFPAMLNMKTSLKMKVYPGKCFRINARLAGSYSHAVRAVVPILTGRPHALASLRLRSASSYNPCRREIKDERIFAIHAPQGRTSRNHGANLSIPDDHDLRRKPLDSRGERRHLDHANARRQGKLAARRHRFCGQGWESGRHPSSFFRTTASPGHLPRTSRFAWSGSCAPGGACCLQRHPPSA